LFVDAHAHLNEKSLSNFVAMMGRSDLGLKVISNSVDFESSVRNIDLSKKFDNIIPFIGIHPEIFSRNGELRITRQSVESMIQSLKTLIPLCSGIGEIGLDPKYGRDGEQEYLLNLMLGISEETGLPISIHNRDSVSRVLDFLSTFNLKGGILLHWFAGSDEELARIQDRGSYISFGPSLLFSKRLGRILEKSDLDLVLSETDSPTSFASINDGRSTPILVPSVVFKMSLISNMGFESLIDRLELNNHRYLERKTH
jgi:TatD DNase family protein